MTEEKHKILCVEDDDDTCELLNYIFTVEGYEVETCRHTDCLNLFREEKFSAIILDNRFAGLSGIEICREIRGFDKHIPIVFFSGEARRSEIEKSLAVGANTYLIKPNDLDKLPGTIKMLITNSSSDV